MFFLRTAAAILLAELTIGAQAPNTVRISDEVVPPGGVAQFKVELTSPQPISTGKARTKISMPLFSQLLGIAAFSSSGNVSGTAVVQGSQIDARLFSTDTIYGVDTDYPLLTIAVAVGADAVPGEKTQVSLGSGTALQDLLGGNVALELKPGTFTVGGSLSIENVVPGGGKLPPGTVVSVTGIGFSQQTKVRIDEVHDAIATFVSSGLIQITFPSGVTLDGKLLRFTNPDNSEVRYYSYIRGVPVGASQYPLLVATTPIFSAATGTKISVPPATAGQVTAPNITGIALQNPNLTSATVTIAQYLGKQIQGQTTITLAPGTRIVREIGELSGVTFGVGDSVHITSSQPIQYLGFVANLQAGTVAPTALRLIAP